MRLAFAIPVLFSTISLAAEPTTQPKNIWESICDGEIRFTIPPGWELVTLGPQGRSAMYKNDELKASLTILSTPQNIAIVDTSGVRFKLGTAILEKIKADQKSQNMEWIAEPAMQKDERFLVSIHDKVKTAEGRTIEQLHLYHPVGVNLVGVTVGSEAADIQSVRKTLKQGQELLLGVVLGKKGKPPEPQEAPAPFADVPNPPPFADRPNPATSETARAENKTNAPQAALTAQPKTTTFAKAHLTITAPSNFSTLTSDTDTGLIATYRDPSIPGGKITVRIQPLAAGANIEKSIDEILASEAMIGGVTRQQDSRFLRKSRRQFQRDGEPVVVESRQRLLGGTVISVTSSAAPDHAQRLSQIADEVTLNIKSATP